MAVNSTLYDWKVFKSLKLHVVQPVQIATTNSFNDSCALLLTQSGKVFAIGKSNVGCLGLGEVRETAEPVELKELSGVAGVCVCWFWGDALAYTSEGTVYVWGDNVSRKRPQLVPELTDVVDARCIDGYYLALTKSGKLYEWRGGGAWAASQLKALSTTPKVVTLNEVITSIACGLYHSLALTKDGQVYSWGKKWKNGIINQPMTKITLPGETVAKVVCGARHSLVLTHSRKLYTWGDNDCGLGDPSGSTKSATPVPVGQDIGRFVDIAVNGSRTNAAVSNTGAVYMWGKGENGAKVKTPTITAYLEIHQVFAKIDYSNYSWTPKPPSSNTVKDSSSVVGKLKASCNDEDLSQLENKETEEQIDNVDAVPPLSCSTPSPSSTPITKLAASQDDQYDNFGKHVASQLREMPLRSFIILQDKINGLITKERLRLCESQDCNVATNIQPEGHLEQSQTNADSDHAESKILHLEEYVKHLKKELAELKENHAKLIEDNAKLKDEIREDNAILIDDLKEANAKLQDQFKYLKAFILPQEQEERGKHNEAAITQPEERGLQLPVVLAQLEHDPTKVDSSNNIEEDNVNLRKELAQLQDKFKSLKTLLFPHERERSSCEDNKDGEIQRGRRGRITPTTASVTYKDNNQNKERERSSCEDNKDREIQRGRRGCITPTTASVTYKDSNQNKQ